MKTLHFSTWINAPREKVWDTMLSDATYREWTEAFHPGSFYRGNLEEAGSEVRFIGPEEDGSESGMMSRVKEVRRPEYIAFEHYGQILKGVEDATSDEVKKWHGSIESYTFTEKDGGTEVAVSVDTVEEYKDMFQGMWPKALQKLKEICER
jgi:uncharacterized protein YndB with AHSA1/START domain